MRLKIDIRITSKMAAHVPVIRKWRLVWERREFGTRVDNETVYLDFPTVNGLTAPLEAKYQAGDIETIGVIEPVISGTGTMIAFRYRLKLMAKYKGLGPFNLLETETPLTSGTIHVMTEQEVYKGVKVNVTAEVVSA